MPTSSRGVSRDLALIATFAALIAALGLTPAIFLPGSPVPVTLQTFGVMVTGLILGARRGALACLTFTALVALGLPVLSGGRGGLGVFAGPTAGYLIGFTVGAFVIGLLIQVKRTPALWWTFIATLLGGVGVVYALGVPVQAARVGTKTLGQTLAGTVVFLPGDLIKAAIAAVVATAVYRGYPAAVPNRPDRGNPAGLESSSATRRRFR